MASEATATTQRDTGRLQTAHYFTPPLAFQTHCIGISAHYINVRNVNRALMHLNSLNSTKFRLDLHLKQFIPFYFTVKLLVPS